MRQVFIIRGHRRYYIDEYQNWWDLTDILGGEV